MLKGVGWLLAVWGGFIVLVVTHRSEAFSVINQDSKNIRMINTVLPNEALEGTETNSNIKDIGLNVGSCTINKFWKSLGIGKVSVETPICSSAYRLLA